MLRLIEAEAKLELELKLKLEPKLNSWIYLSS